MAFPAVPKTWVAGAVVTAAQLNAELRDALNDLPRYVAQASSTSDQTGIGAGFSDVTFATASWTGVAGRLYRITFTAKMVQVTSTGSQTISIQTGATGAGTVLNESFISVTTNFWGPSTWTAFHTGTGALTAHVRAATSVGTITVSNSVIKGWFVVEDIGPRP